MNKTSFAYTIKVIIYILIITYFADKVLYYALNRISDNILAGQSGGKLNHFLLVKDTTDVIIFGNSRANHHIDPKKLSKTTYNMGADARSIAYCSALTMLLPKNKKQTVIINVDTKNSFDDNYLGEDVGVLRVRYHRNPILKFEIDNVFGYDIIQNFYWCKAYNGKILGLFKNYFIPKYNYKEYYGYDPIFVNETDKEIFKNVLINSKNQKCDDHYSLNPLYKSYIEKIKKFCNSYNKRLIMITTPLYNDICKKDNLKMKAVFKEANIEYYDFSDEFKNNNKLEFWKDEVHLSNEGAQKFSEILNEVINLN